MAFLGKAVSFLASEYCELAASFAASFLSAFAGKAI